MCPTNYLLEKLIRTAQWLPDHLIADRVPLDLVLVLLPDAGHTNNVSLVDLQHLGIALSCKGGRYL